MEIEKEKRNAERKKAQKKAQKQRAKVEQWRDHLSYPVMDCFAIKLWFLVKEPFLITRL